ncbi:uncharacterized protein LOC142241290 [Haematobia irritans]|uniref:uncharacterized protein LOC142241290 n=1 Tax=Haematobia irritans TaxID=7368 RepID=UPI003F4F9A67
MAVIRIFISSFLMVFVILSRSISMSVPLYVTCDFDLEDIVNLLQYLPPECTQIYNNRHVDPSTYQLYMDESKAFAKFHQKLIGHEQRSAQQTPALEIHPFDKELRDDIYRKNDKVQCVQKTNGTSADFLNCIKNKNMGMERMIPTPKIK